MSKLSKFPLSFLPAAALALTLGAGEARSTALGCQNGPAKGDWALPSSSGANDGWLSGKLIDGSTNQGVYAFDAMLTDQPTACLSCIAGTIEGYLDDGFGPAPDFVVKGEYFGQWLQGTGEFVSYVYELGGSDPVGKIVGRFADSPGNPDPGVFEGEWEICN